jgi:hypothetical protein
MQEKKICGWCGQEITDDKYSEIWNKSTGKLVIRLHDECAKDENLQNYLRLLLNYGPITNAGRAAADGSRLRKRKRKSV